MCSLCSEDGKGRLVPYTATDLEQGVVHTLDEPIDYRTVHLCCAVLDVVQRKDHFIGMVPRPSAEFSTVVA